MCAKLGDNPSDCHLIDSLVRILASGSSTASEQGPASRYMLCATAHLWRSSRTFAYGGCDMKACQLAGVALALGPESSSHVRGATNAKQLADALRTAAYAAS